MVAWYALTICVPPSVQMLNPTSVVMGAGLGQDCALITDGRFSGGSHGFCVGHVAPEAQARLLLWHRCAACRKSPA